MSFWDLENGETAAASTEYEAPSGGSIIPAKTGAIMLIDEIAWKTTQTDSREYINIRYNVLEPDDYNGRKVFQKLWVTDDDPNAKDPVKKRENAKRFLAALFGVTGGTMPAGKPTDAELMQELSNRPLWGMIMVWSMPDRDNPNEKIEGNWISAIKKASEGEATQAAKAPADLDDEIPF